MIKNKKWWRGIALNYANCINKFIDERADLRTQLSQANEAIAREQASVEDLWIRNKDLQERVKELESRDKLNWQRAREWREGWWEQGERISQLEQEIERLNAIANGEPCPVICIREEHALVAENQRLREGLKKEKGEEGVIDAFLD